MDYLGYFGLATEPFTHAPAPKLYFSSQKHTAALQRLMHTVGTGKGLAVLIGDIGHGKTTLARRLLDALPTRDYEAALLVIVHGGITAAWLLKRIASQLGVDKPADNKLDILAQLYERLLAIHSQGRRAVVLIDEAQMLATREIMEEFRGLLNIEMPGQKLISFVFFGLPELEGQLALDPPLLQRVAMRYRLQPLEADDTASYVQHRLKAAGTQELIFSADALAAVHQLTRGVPRVINTLCDNVLLELFFARQRAAGSELVHQVADQLALTTAVVTPAIPEALDDSPALPGSPGEDAVAVVGRDEDTSGLSTDLAADIASRVAAEALDDVAVDVEPPTPEEVEEPADGGMAGALASAAAAAEVSEEVGDEVVTDFGVEEGASSEDDEVSVDMEVDLPIAASANRDSAAGSPELDSDRDSAPMVFAEEPAVPTAPIVARPRAAPAAAVSKPIATPTAASKPPVAPAKPAPTPMPPTSGASATKKPINLQEIDDLLADIAKLT